MSSTPTGGLDSQEVDHSIAMVTAGLKPVAKLEGEGDEHLGLWLAALALRAPELELRQRPSTAHGSWEIFLGRDRTLVEEALELTARSEVERDEQPLQLLLTQLGELLGYPRCCARSFAKAGRRLRDDNEWLRVARRLNAPEQVSPLFHPAFTGYVPCSLTCQPTVQLMEAVAAMPEAPLRPWLEYPTLLLLHRPGQLAALAPLTPVDDGFEAEPSMISGDDPSLAQLASARRWTVNVTPGTITLQQQTTTIELGSQAFLWWSGGVLHRNWWQRRLEAHLSSPDPPLPTSTLPTSTWERALKRLVDRSPRALAGYELDRLEPTENRAVVVLRRGEERLQLHLALAADQVDRSLAVAGPLALTGNRPDPLKNADQQKAARVVLELLARLTDPNRA